MCVGGGGGSSVGNDCDRGEDYLGRVRFEASRWSTQGVSTHLVHTETPPLPHGKGKRDGANGGGGGAGGEGGSWGWSGDLGGGVCGVGGGGATSLLLGFHIPSELSSHTVCARIDGS